MTTPNQSLLDWLDDLCVRFIVNLPMEELQSVERICFQIEEAQWFYEDFIRPLDPRLPSMNLRSFSQRMFQHCPLFAGFTGEHFVEAFNHFLLYKTRVPVRGAIMLNEDMTHAVLVKGWKKGAKWSFPRGKINKDEPDLDCAIREVYEETGYDLKEAGLVLPESEMKGISIAMREQNMLLYVFRGVPMDTHFEPRTRKEISKIDWYKLSDLPTLKRKNQVQQGTGQDLLKDNSFYMVAPFLGPLKAWIKTQKRLDRQRAHAGSHAVPPPPAGVTDTEGLEPDLGETTADEAAMPDAQVHDANFAALVANLGRSHRTSDQLPEVSSHADPAAELKRLLSVGIGFPSQPQPVEAPQSVQEPPHNPLLAMLRGNNGSAPPHQLPQTPFEQLMPTPQLPQSPHGQHHPRPPHLDQMQPPPQFPLHQQQALFRGQQHPRMGHQQHNGFAPPGHNQFASPSHHPNPPYPMDLSNVQQSLNGPAPPPFMRTGDPQFAQPAESGHGPAIPPASKLPPPNLTAHSLSLLRTFKVNEKPAISSPVAPIQEQPQSSQATPIATRPPPLPQQPSSLIPSPPAQNGRSYAPSPPAFQSPPPMQNFQPVQPKPRNAHQDTLLKMFQSPSLAAAMPATSRTPEPPVELSAHPLTPGYVKAKPAAEAGPPVPDMSAKPNLLSTLTVQPKPDLTSATVRGPVNAPDFETVRKHASVPSNGNSRGPSPALSKPEQKTFVPQQILRRDRSIPRSNISATEPNRSSNASPATIVSPGASFKPQILKRPAQSSTQGPPNVSAHARGLLNVFKAQQTATQPSVLSHSPLPTPAASAHAQNLLGYFQQSSPQPQAAQASVPTSRSPAPTLPVAAHPPVPTPSASAHAQNLLSYFQQTSPQPQAAQASVPASRSPAPTQPVSAHAQDLLSILKQASPQPEAMQASAPPSKSPAPPAQISVSSSHQGNVPTEHKNPLLPLLGNNSAPLTASPVQAAPSVLPLVATHSVLPARSPQPPTPKTYMSGVISPVSPLPGSQTDSPAHLNSRSRISSIGDTMPPSIVIPPTNAPTSYPQIQPSQQSNGFGTSIDSGMVSPASGAAPGLGLGIEQGKGKAGTDSAGKSPVDKMFLLGFLNDVARKGR